MGIKQGKFLGKDHQHVKNLSLKPNLGENMPLTFLDFFSGIGGFRRGMELAGHRCLGHCEYDKYANKSYSAIHNIREDEWFKNDIREVMADELPKADVWCFGFPCQDISVAGRQRGFSGQRSSLFFTVTRIIRNTKEENRPKLLFIENVKNLLSVNGGTDFLKLLIELDEIGYDAEWQILNSKDFGVPQNRERVFIIGHFRGKCRSKIFPITGNCTKTKIEQVGMLGIKGAENIRRVYGQNGLAPSLTTMQGGNRQPKILFKTTLAPGRANKEQSGIEELFIRKLTPKECFRLQGWSDEDFEKSKKVCSDSQLYKQAGNGVTINVIYEIAKKLF